MLKKILTYIIQFLLTSSLYIVIYQDSLLENLLIVDLYFFQERKKLLQVSFLNYS